MHDAWLILHNWALQFLFSKDVEFWHLNAEINFQRTDGKGPSGGLRSYVTVSAACVILGQLVPLSGLQLLYLKWGIFIKSLPDWTVWNFLRENTIGKNELLWATKAASWWDGRH